MTVRRIETTVGRCLFNAAAAAGLPLAAGLTDGRSTRARLKALAEAVG